MPWRFMAGFMRCAMGCCRISACALAAKRIWQIASNKRWRGYAGEPAAEADGGRHFGFGRYNILRGGPRSLAATFGEGGIASDELLSLLGNSPTKPLVRAAAHGIESPAVLVRFHPGRAGGGRAPAGPLR